MASPPLTSMTLTVSVTTIMLTADRRTIHP